MEIFDLVAEALRPAFFIVLLGALVGFPVYVVGRFAGLRRDIEDLKREVSGLQATVLAGTVATVTPTVATVPASAFAVTLSDFDLPPVPATVLPGPVES